jgi:arylsulfatase A-like enzyme
VAGLLKQHGYHTAVIGKWHLGLNWERLPGRPAPERNDIEKSNQVWSVDFSKPIAGGPTSLGFDYFFGLSASLDMVPYTFIENDRVTVLPTEDKAFPMTEGRPGGLTRRGPAAPGFRTEDVLPTFTRKAVEYLGARAAAAKAGQPFFLYLPLNAPHTPIAPTSAWRGRSSLSPYADFVMQTDHSIGQVLEALDQHGLSQNTLVIATSDNGCSPAANITELQAAGHEPNGPWRGHKADIWEGGHRVPFLVRWPDKIKPGAVCGRLISLMDSMATCADIVGAKLPNNAGEDSLSFLPLLLEPTAQGRRESLVHHSIQGRFALRHGQWKLALCPGSGGWSAPRDANALKQGLPLVQLYDMVTDPTEKTNLQADQPDTVKRLQGLLEQCVADGRSTPGRRQPNDVPVDVWKRKAP